MKAQVKKTAFQTGFARHDLARPERRQEAVSRLDHFSLSLIRTCPPVGRTRPVASFGFPISTFGFPHLPDRSPPAPQKHPLAKAFGVRGHAATLQRLQRFNASTLQRLNASTPQRFNAPTLQPFNAPTLQRCNQ